MSKDSFVEQLASFDLSTPVEVKVIFEDEEDEVASADINIKQENTTEEESYQTNGTTAPWQQGTSGYIRPDPKQIVPQPLMQPEHQHQEIARSGSTDSGFMSPLNFYSPETIKDGTEDDSLLLSPLITHVTSLHPEVTYIKEGSCYVCGNMTRKMCNGCYRKYYCSLECQRFDWNIHKTTCGSAT
ncbi:hypothetical protein O0L34_g6024 [Tuta absoluta]|nr:hypothetical protein O0L34_g6024 [Tuta absoluta]